MIIYEIDMYHVLCGMYIYDHDIYTISGVQIHVYLSIEARRLLTVDLRDQLVQTLRDYRRHFEPTAFRPALRLWSRCYREMRCAVREEEPGQAL